MLIGRKSKKLAGLLRLLAAAARFCPVELERQSSLEQAIHWLQEGHPHYMGKRVAQATDLSVLLTGSPTAALPDRTALVEC